MSVGRGLYVELSSAPTGDGNDRDRKGDRRRAAAQLGSMCGCAVRPSLRPDLIGNCAVRARASAMSSEVFGDVEGQCIQIQMPVPNAA